MKPSPEECQMAMNIALKPARGLEPTSKERLALKQHVRGCRNCLAENSIVEIISGDEENSVSFNEISKRRMSDQVILEARRARDISSFRPRRSISKLGLFAATFSALAALVAIVVLWSKLPEESPQLKSSSSEGDALLTANTGVLSPVDTPHMTRSNVSSLNAPIETKGGRTAVKLSSRTKLLLGERSKMAVQRMDKDSIEVFLFRGALLASIDPEQEGPKFSVLTSKGKMEVVGTVFQAAVKGESVEVEVLRGRVRIHEETNSRHVSANHGTTMGEDNRHWELLTPDQEVLARDLKELESLGADASAVIDFSRFVEDPNVPVRVAKLDRSKKAVSNKHSKQSVAELLDRVRFYRRAGDWLSAAEVYQTLVRTYPGTEAAMTSLVALGELELVKLKRPTAALGRFGSYLQSGGTSLAEEAILGKARALRALGRTGEEFQTLELFADRFPSSPHVPKVRKRLGSINSGGHS